MALAGSQETRDPPGALPVRGEPPLEPGQCSPPLRLPGPGRSRHRSRGAGKAARSFLREGLQRRREHRWVLIHSPNLRGFQLFHVFLYLQGVLVDREGLSIRGGQRHSRQLLGGADCKLGCPPLRAPGPAWLLTPSALETVSRRVSAA